MSYSDRWSVEEERDTPRRMPECLHALPFDSDCPDCANTLFDPVEKPAHYNTHPSGIETILITEHMNFCLGNVMKYVWRADRKNGLEDLKKAAWYLDREIKRRENAEV